MGSRYSGPSAGGGAGSGVSAEDAQDSYQTRSAVAAIASPASGRLVYLAELDASFRFNAASALAADGWLVLAAADATPGKWELVGDRVSVAPMLWSSFADLWDAAAYKAEIHMRPGIWTCGSAERIPSGTTIVGAPGVSIQAALAPTGGVENGVFYHVPTASVAGELAAPTSQGATLLTFDTVDLLTDLGWIALDDGANHVAQYQITDPEGVTFTASVDRPIMHDFATGTAVLLRTPPMDITIRGNGMRIFGTADTAIELSGALRCHVSGIVVPAGSGFAETIINLDVGARLSSVRGCVVDGSGTADSGINIESCEECMISGCTVSRCNGAGYLITNCYAACIESSRAYACSRGLSTSNGLSSYSARSVTVDNCHFDGCYDFGIEVANGSTRILIANTECRGNNAGIAVNSSPASVDVLLVNCNLSANLTYGLFVVAGSSGVKAANLTCSGNGTWGVYADGDLALTGYCSAGCVSGGVSVNLAANVTIQEADLSVTASGTWFGINASGSGGIIATNVRIAMSGAGTKVGVGHAGSAAGTTYLRQVKSTGGTIGVNIPAGTVIRGESVDFSSAVTPFSASGSGAVRDALSFAATAGAVLAETGATLSRRTGAALGAGGLEVLSANGVRWTVAPESSAAVNLRRYTFVAPIRINASTPFVAASIAMVSGHHYTVTSTAMLHQLSPDPSFSAGYERYGVFSRADGTSRDIQVNGAIYSGEPGVTAWSHTITRATNSIDLIVSTSEVGSLTDALVICDVLDWTVPTV